MMEQSPRKALIVEEDPVTRMLLAAMVADHGYKALVCSEAESGWVCFEKEHPQLVLLDWLLPGMHGLKLCKRIRACRAGRYTVVVMLTTRDRHEELEAAARAGIDHYFVKPVTQQFRPFLTMLQRNVQERSRLEEQERQMEACRLEIESTTVQLEEAISRANRLTMEAELAFVELNQLFSAAAGGILLVDRDHNLIRFNETFLEMAGVSQQEAEGRKCYQVFSSSFCHTADCPLEQIEAGEKRVTLEICRQHREGMLHFAISASPYLTPDGDLLGIVEYISDITDRVRIEEALKESERQYRELSIIDELTQLFNKRHFKTRLEAEVARTRRYGRPLALLMLDIDNFKMHNDTYGHLEGDRVLARLGAILQASIRGADLACRYGGEEFAVILPETDGEHALVVAERIRHLFEAENFQPETGERKVHKTVSVGVAEYRPDEKPEQFVARADQHLYRAKKEGKNRVVPEGVDGSAGQTADGLG